MGELVSDMDGGKLNESAGCRPADEIYTILDISEKHGLESIIESYAAVLRRWRSDCRRLTELSMALNRKGFEHQEDSIVLSELYFSLYGAVDKYAKEYLKDEDLRYYLRTTD